jgi:hypothetical protein
MTMTGLQAPRGLLFPLTLLIAGALLLGSAAASFSQTNGARRLECVSYEPILAHFTGEVERGTPVYRLPAITVSASPKAAVVEAQTQRRDSRNPQSRARAAS